MANTTDQKKPAGNVTRRQFLKRTAGATAAAVAFPMIIPGSALGKNGAVAPSNRIVMACIGVGSQGKGDLEGFLKFKEAQVVAVADVDAKHRAEAMKMINGTYDNNDCKEFNDFREMLEMRGLDAIQIAVPDHWHSLTAIAAARKKYDIYAEKPLALTISEGRAMVDAVEHNKIIWQTGSWQRSQTNFRVACEMVRSGRIGDVHTVEVGLPTGSTIESQAEQPIPESFDYDFWLGPAPAVPYTEKRCHWNFRWILDYSGGQLTDWAAHHVDIANWGMDTESTGPVEVEGQGVFPTDGLWDTATDYWIVARYAPGASPVAPKGFNMILSNAFENGTKFRGTKGSIFVSRGNTLETDPKEIKETPISEKEVNLYKSTNHAGNFLECVRSRKPTITPIHAAHHAIAVAHLGNISMRLGRKVHWDPKAERFINDATADRMLSRAMRTPWTI